MRGVLATFLIFLSSSCFNQGDCLITASSYARIDLFDKVTRQPFYIHFTNITVSGSETIFYQDSIKSALLLPLNSKEDTTRFTLNYDGKSDFITLSYSSQSRVISPDCGAFLYFKDLEIVSTSFDQGLIRVVNAQLLKDAVNNNYVTNLQIFF